MSMFLSCMLEKTLPDSEYLNKGKKLSIIFSSSSLAQSSEILALYVLISLSRETFVVP